MPRRVLITGITGFAGSHLAERLVRHGYGVHGIAHEPEPYPYLAAIRDRVTIHSASVTDAPGVAAAFESARPEIVFHLAGQAVPTLASADPHSALEVNVIGTANVADGAARQGAHLVAASSAHVYGIPDHTPTAEDAPVRATNVYAATKILAEAVLRDAGTRTRVTILRPCNQVGPRQHPRLAASEFARRIAEAEAGVAEPVVRHGHLNARREFIDVRDMAAAYEAAAGIDHPGAAVYNVGSGRAIEVREVLETLRRAARVPIRTELDPAHIQSDTPPLLLVDDARFRRVTGWSPALPLERSLLDTLDFWRDVVKDRVRTPGIE